MLRLIQTVIAFIGLVYFSAGYAALDLELTQGTSAAIPIALTPFTGDPGLAGKLTQIIDQDLKNSGQFKLLPASKGPLSEVLTYCKAQGANALLTGTVQKKFLNRYQVTFSLWSVFDVRPGAGSGLLMSHTFDMKLQDYRALTHHISDLIYEKLTGVRGIFSTKIAYVSVSRPGDPQHVVYRLMVADADGYRPAPLLESSEPIMSPTWSPDGRNIAYVSFERHRAGVYLQNLSTGKRTLVSQVPGINGAPAFSPDGKELALVLSKNESPNIYLLNLKTHKFRALISDEFIDTEPAFSPDGQSLLFTSNREGNPQIYEYFFNTGKIKRVTYEGNYNARASFLPDKQGIILMHRRSDAFGIALQNKEEVALLTQGGGDESPSVAPNGKMVIYTQQEHGQGMLAEVSIDGKITLRLPSSEGVVQEPSWSPFL